MSNTPPNPPPSGNTGKWRFIIEAIQKRRDAARARRSSGTDSRPPPAPGGSGIPPESGDDGRIRLPAGMGSTGDSLLDVMHVWLTENAKEYKVRLSMLNSYGVNNFVDDVERVQNVEDKYRYSAMMSVRMGGALGSSTASRIANFAYQYETMPALGMLSGLGGLGGDIAASFFTTKSNIIKEAQDHFGNLGSMAGTGLGLGISTVAKYVPAGTPVTGFAKIALNLASFAASTYLSAKGDALGREMAEKLVGGYAEEQARKIMAASMVRPDEIVGFYQNARNSLGIYSDYNGSNLKSMAYSLTNGGEMGWYGADMSDMTSLVGQVNRTNSVNDFQTAGDYAKRIMKFSGSTGYGTGEYSKLIGSVRSMYGASDSPHKDRDINSVAEGVQQLLVAGMGAHDVTPLGLETALGLSALSQSLLVQRNTTTGKKAVNNIANIQNFVRGFQPGKADISVTTTTIEAVNSLLTDGTMMNKTPARTRFVSKLGISVNRALGGLEADSSLLPLVLTQIIKDTGLKKGDLSVKNGGITGDSKKLGRLKYYLGTGGTVGLDMDANAVESLSLMTAAYLERDKKGLDDVKELLPEFSKEEARRTKRLLMSDQASILKNTKTITDETTKAISKFVPSMIEISRLSTEFFRHKGAELAKEYVRQVNSLLKDSGKSGRFDYTDLMGNVIGGINDDSAIIYGDRYVTSKLVRTDSRGYEKYSKLFEPGFVKGVEAVAGRLKVDPNWLLGIMSFETIGTFSPSITNKFGYSGLLQFSEDYKARMLKRDGVDITKLSQVEQLKYVEDYLSPHVGKYNSIGDLYLSVAAPAFLNRERNANTVIYTGDAAVNNKKWNPNGDGKVTYGELVNAIENDALSVGFIFDAQGNRYISQVGSVTTNYTANYNLKGVSIRDTLYDARAASRETVSALSSNIGFAIFGNKNHRFGSNIFNSEGFRKTEHEGIDFSVKVGTPIIALSSGVLTFKEIDDDGYGIGLGVRYTIGDAVIDAFYGHLSKIALPIGSKVKQGQVIAYSGNTGFSTGAHVHFQAVLVNEKLGIRMNDRTNLYKYFNGVKNNINYTNAFLAAMQILGSADPTASAQVNAVAASVKSGMSIDEIKEMLAKKFPNVMFNFDKSKGMYIVNAYNSGTGKGVSDSTKKSISNLIKESNSKLSFSVSNRKTVVVKVNAVGVKPGALASKVQQGVANAK